MSLKYKLIIFLMLAAVLPIITVIFIFRVNVSKILIGKNTEYSISMASSKSESIDKLFGDTENALLNICTNVNTIDYLESVNSKNFHEDDKYRLISEIGAQLETFLNLYQVIDGIYIMPGADGMPIYRGALNLDYIENYSISPVYKNSITTPEKIIWALSPGHSDNVFKLTISKGIIDSYNGKVLGVLVIDLTVNNLFTNYPVSNLPKDDFLFVTDGKNQIIYSNNSSETGTSIGKQLLNYDMGKSTGNFELNTGDSSFMATFTTSSINGWKIYYITPKARVLQGVDRVSQIILIVAILFIAFSIIAALFIFFTLYNPIYKLITAMRKIEDGNMDLEVQIRSNDEIGKLAGTYNYLIKKIKAMIEDVKASQKKKTELEIRALQAQITPHFLYNTLNCTISLARMGKNNVIVDMVGSLIDLLRTIANNKEAVISIKDEINYVKSYIRIMTYRYDIPVNVSFEIEDSLLNYGILKFTIQPIVENSFMHAFQGARSKYDIIIRAFIVGELVNIEIEDNGIGMDSRTLDEISDRFANTGSAKEKLTGIGMENIHQRLIMEFGHPAGLYIASKEGKGTTVRVVLPKICLESNS